ncbi:hypothetical protein FFWV33_15315 [Flavobacterium faecale]|uniref:GH16 domain-containing protein n=1 Tax=Flavobacterium faecale TaxID=1355330 RepID=A0A2S1LGG4_9FLAO|nr:family 16 glycosylhydrolase [Flavobacterium faecale]AWG22799.1 hypothetical protein FFWV33_15315 [Flavobacterium faecale]
MKATLLSFIALSSLILSCTNKEESTLLESASIFDDNLISQNLTNKSILSTNCPKPADANLFIAITNNNSNVLNRSQNGMGTWVLIPELSNEFNYSSKTDPAFTTDWKDSYINSWTGPAPTKWVASGSSLGTAPTGEKCIILQATKVGNTLECGMVTSKAKATFPLYQEARVRISDSHLANAVWMLSTDSREEIDNLESYGDKLGSKPYFGDKLHLSHHTFKDIAGVRKDYQPQLETWMIRKTGAGCNATDDVKWNTAFHIFGVKWVNATNLEYYVDGVKVRTVTGTDIDPNGYTDCSGMKKALHMIISQAAQTWRFADMNEFFNQNITNGARTKMYIDWIRVYRPNQNLGTSTCN